jgi:hypothetical protein
VALAFDLIISKSDQVANDHDDLFVLVLRRRRSQA